MAGRARTALVGLAVVVGVALATAMLAGGTTTIFDIDDFEDNDTTIERPEWSGWDVNAAGSFNASQQTVINGSFSGQLDIANGGDNITATRDTTTTKNLTWRTIYDGDDSAESGFDFTVRDGTTDLVTIRYDEDAAATGDIEVRNGTITNINTFDEDARNVQNWTLSFNFTADTVTVFLNGTDEGTFDLQNSASGYDTFVGEALAGGTYTDHHMFIDDVGVSEVANEPLVDNGSASPTGNLEQQSATLSIDINDSDFPTSEGDSVTVEFFMQNPDQSSRTSVGTDTLTSNGTASVSVNTNLGGTYEWNATATDSYGLTNSSQVFTFDVPSNLTIRNETSPHGPVTGCTANVRFYETTDDNPVITERTDTDNDGNVSLAGLPVGAQFAASVKCDGYNNRTILIDDIFTQNNAFLLHESRDESLITFQVDDRTGQFDNGELLVEKAINETEYNSSADGFEWLTVAGDELNAADEFTTYLENGGRYRLTVRNDAGDQVILGPYTPVADDVETLVVGQVGVRDAPGNETVFNASIEDSSQLGNPPPVIQIEFTNPANITDEPDRAVSNFNYSVFEAGNASNQIDSGTASGDLGTFYAETNISDAQADEKWIVQVQYEVDGETITQRRIVGGASVDISGDPEWIALFSLVVITSVGMLYGKRTANVGIVMLYLTAGVAMLLQVITISVAWYGVTGFLVAGALLRGELR